MEFLVLAYDGKDDGALERRLRAREAHLAAGWELRRQGHLRYGAAIRDETGERMIGSVLVVDFPTRSDVDEWLATEPYVTGDVWRDVQVAPCGTGPWFAGQH